MTLLPPSAGGRGEVDQEGDNGHHYLQDAPFASEYVQHDRIPEQGRRQKDEPEQGEQDRVEQALEPWGEKPEAKDNEPWDEQGKKGKQAGHDRWDRVGIWLRI